MEKYRVFCGNIEKIEIERETKKSIWINDKRYDKHGWDGDIFDTWEQAKNELIELSLKKIDALKKQPDSYILYTYCPFCGERY